MPSVDSEVKTARMSAETWGIVQREMEEEGVTFSGWVKKKAQEGTPLPTEMSHKTSEASVHEGVPQLNEDVYTEIEGMIKFYGVSVEDYLKDLSRSLNEGSLMYEGGRIRGVSEIDMEKFKDACHEANKDVQTMVNKCAQMIERSMI